MKTIHIYLAAAMAAATLSSCEDMDLTPDGRIATESRKSDVYANDPDKSFAAVSGAFMKLSAKFPNEDAVSERHSDFGYPSIMLFTDCDGEDVVSSATGYNHFSGNATFRVHTASSYVNRIIWNDLYSYIYNANLIVAGVDPETDNSTLKFNRAQGLALRAFCYFQLAQLYQFTLVGNEDKPCVPLITDVNSDDAAQNGAKRATVQEVYDQIYADIDEAIALLADAQKAGEARKDKRYVDLATAYGIRARVNLVAQKWAAAASDASNAINESSAKPASIAEVSYPTFSSVSENDWMWGIIIAKEDAVVKSGIVNWISHIGSLSYGYSNYSGGMRISEKLFSTISDTDVRKGWWLNEQGYSANLSEDVQSAFKAYSGSTVSEYYAPFTNVKFGPYDGKVAGDDNANDVPLMRIEEMFLIKAEGEAMSGADGLATLTNFLTAYRDPKYSYSGSDIQHEIWRQRRIELWGEGMSWFDIMRLKTGFNRLSAGFESTYVYVLDYDDANLLWPIPESEIEANRALSVADQNPSNGTPSAKTGTSTIDDEKINI